MSHPEKKTWEDAYSVIEPQINASGVHEWNFDPAFPIDLRYFVMRQEADIRLNHHSYFEILYLTSGEVEYQVADRFYRLRQGDLFVMGGALPHKMSQLSGSRVRCVTLYFEPEFIRAHDSSRDDVQYLMPFLVQTAGFPHVVPASTGVPAQVYEFMKSISEMLPADTTRLRLTVRTLVKMILVLLVNHYGDYADSAPMLTQRQRDLERLQPLFDYIERHYMNPLTVPKAASVVHMSKSHFMRFFKQVTGEPFVAHLNQFRVAKAQQLLASTDRSIADIGQDVGFCNQSYFGLVFRRIVGSNPRDYKARLLAEAVRSAPVQSRAESALQALAPPRFFGLASGK